MIASAAVPRLTFFWVLALSLGGACNSTPNSAPDAGSVPDSSVPDAGGPDTSAPDTSFPDGNASDEPLCAAGGAACAASGCCQLPYEACIPAGSANAMCQHADLPPTMGPACDGAASSDLPGVSVEFPDDRCSYSAAEVAAGIIIKYTFVVANTLTAVTPASLNLGRCGQPDSDFGLIVMPALSGQGQSYCLCDEGRCDAMPTTTTVPAGRYDRNFSWTGKNWNGPSDTNQPLGAAFPPGTYTFNVSATGIWVDAADAPSNTPFTVTANRTITITP